MNLSQGKRLWALFTSSTDEVAGDSLMQGPYRNASCLGAEWWNGWVYEMMLNW